MSAALLKMPVTGTAVLQARSGRSFDYSALDATTADAVRRKAESIKYRQTCIGKEIIGIGADLIDVKSKLGHGRFSSWLSTEFDWDERTARRFMSVAEAFRDKSDTVADLLPTTLYALAAPSTPETVRQEVVRLREKGEHIADHIVRSMISAGKRTQDRTDRRRATREAREARSSPQAIRRAEKERQESEARLRKSNEALVRIVEIIRDRFGDALPEFVALLEQAGPGPGGLWRLTDELQKLAGGDLDSVATLRRVGDAR